MQDYNPGNTMTIQLYDLAGADENLRFSPYLLDYFEGMARKAPAREI